MQGALQPCRCRPFGRAGRRPPSRLGAGARTRRLACLAARTELPSGAGEAAAARLQRAQQILGSAALAASFLLTSPFGTAFADEYSRYGDDEAPEQTWRGGYRREDYTQYVSDEPQSRQAERRPEQQAEPPRPQEQQQQQQQAQQPQASREATGRVAVAPPLPPNIPKEYLDQLPRCVDVPQYPSVPPRQEDQEPPRREASQQQPPERSNQEEQQRREGGQQQQQQQQPRMYAAPDPPRGVPEPPRREEGGPPPAKMPTAPPQTPRAQEPQQRPPETVNARQEQPRPPPQQQQPPRQGARQEPRREQQRVAEERRPLPGFASGPPGIPTSFPPLPVARELPMREVSLSNGLRVFLIEDHEVPIVKGTIAMKGGLRASPPDKVGLATIALAVQRAGGTESHPGDALNDALEMMAAGIETSARPDANILGFECLKEDAKSVLGLVAEVLTSPVVPQKKLALYQAQMVNLLQHRDDDPGSIPRRELSKLVYGRDSVFARSASVNSIKKLTKEDVEGYLRKWERPDGAVMGVLGDFDSDEMAALLEQKLGRWHKPDSSRPAPLPSTPVPRAPGGRGKVFLVDRPGQEQAVVAMGEVGVDIRDPDAPALDVLNEILNSFGGKLFNEIRSKEGLAYSVSGGFNTSTVDHKGLFLAGGETADAGAFIASLERSLQEVTQAPPSQEVLEAAKARTLNSFVFNFASAESQLQRAVGFSLLGLPQDYLYTYRDKIAAVTAEDVLNAAQHHLHPQQQTVVVVADAEAHRKDLEKQGRAVVAMDLEQP